MIIFICFLTAISFSYSLVPSNPSFRGFIVHSKKCAVFYYNHTLSQIKLPNLMWVQDFFLIQYFFNFLCGIQGDLENTFSVACTQLYKLLCWSIGVLVSWSVGPLVCWFVSPSVADCLEHATYGNGPCCNNWQISWNIIIFWSVYCICIKKRHCLSFGPSLHLSVRP